MFSILVARRRVNGSTARSSLESSPKRRAATNWRTLHDHETGSLKVLDQPLRDDLRHDLIGVMRPLATGKPQRERERRSEVIGRGGLELVGVGHCGTIVDRLEQSKNGES
jgi:hypothetical protein